MPKFTDAKSREWNLSITATSLRNVKPEKFGGVNLGKPDGGQLFAQLADPMLMVDLCFALCESQARAAGVDADSFGDGMAGQVIEDARRALVTAVIEFQPARNWGYLRLVADTIERAEAIALESVTEKFKSGEIDRAVAAALAAQ